MGIDIIRNELMALDIPCVLEGATNELYSITINPDQMLPQVEFGAFGPGVEIGERQIEARRQHPRTLFASAARTEPRLMPSLRELFSAAPADEVDLRLDALK